MVKVLWLTPNFNHYKARFLNHLASESDIDLHLISGTGRTGYGDKELHKNWLFKHNQLPVSKKRFGFSVKAAKAIKSEFSEFDWVLISTEKKNLLLFIYLIWLRFLARKKGENTKLFTYCHPLTKSGGGKITIFDLWITKFYFKHFDRVIFYTEQSHDLAVKHGYINREKAYWANNTIDTTEIDKVYSFSYPPDKPLHIVFIGRLIPSKKVSLAISYFEELQKRLDGEAIILDVIGDGPDVEIVENAAKANTHIVWHGALIEEHEIAPIMQNASFVFLPGDSGLSINHAFAYGRPYLTLESDNHGPEISYIEDNLNGMILPQVKKASNLEKIKTLVKDKALLHRYCDAAKKKSLEISLPHWILKVKNTLLDD
ncbi:glycosyltransferase family 4 protein [Winogradskyella sp. KYW1333]|uniref:glycosyltransferase family 4 protein n=1 Tax=Winogradskyella sp. KYW1333 TaxID=2282123 RepID=UPI000DF26541|nr:glycosyltransferase family 4 protein [Winogradskyella sp. KYW1333]RCT55357.1 glycosyltransferase [Winogradskyella sp. KYW1333]